VAPGDGKALVDRILQLAGDPQLCCSLGARARATFVDRWDKLSAVEQWEEVLTAVVRPAQEQAGGVQRSLP
jgi:hypothetical protein